MIKLECPYCKKDNGIKLPENAECRHCKRSIDNYSFKNGIFNATNLKMSATLLVGGMITGYVVENILDEARYPVVFEYNLINQCAGKGSYYNNSRNIELCSCALENTMKEVGAKKKIDEIWKSSFRNNLEKCR